MSGGHSKASSKEPSVTQKLPFWGILGRGVNRISAAGKHLRSREWHGVPRKEGTGARFVPGRGKCYGFAANRFTFPPQEYDIALTDAIHEISWSNRKLLNLHKTLYINTSRSHELSRHAPADMQKTPAGATENRQHFTTRTLSPRYITTN